MGQGNLLPRPGERNGLQPRRRDPGLAGHGSAVMAFGDPNGSICSGSLLCGLSSLGALPRELPSCSHSHLRGLPELSPECYCLPSGGRFLRPRPQQGEPRLRGYTGDEDLLPECPALRRLPLDGPELLFLALRDPRLRRRSRGVDGLREPRGARPGKLHRQCHRRGSLRPRLSGYAQRLPQGLRREQVDQALRLLRHPRHGEHCPQ